MIKPVSRRQIFEISNMADVEIAKRQYFYFDQFKGEDPDLIKSVSPSYDHTQPLFNKEIPQQQFCVLAFDEAWNECSYEKGFAAAFIKFLMQLDIQEIILVQDLCHTWDHFGFDTNKDHLEFQKLVGDTSGTNGWLLDKTSLANIMPLLYHNNPDEGDCSFYTLSNHFQLGILFWKGNLHVSFYESGKAALEAAAGKAKLIIGDRDTALSYRYGKKFQ